MEETFPTTCIVLKRIDFREVDSRVTVYSRGHGLLELIARGTKKLSSKLAPHLEPITKSKIMVIKGRQYDYVGGAAGRDSFKGIKESGEKLQAAGQAARFFLQIVKAGISDKGLYELLQDYFVFINNNMIKSPELWAYIFLLKILSHLGYRPELYHCINDGEKIESGQNYFNAQKGGLVCSRCPCDTRQFAVSDDCVKILRLIINENFTNISKININKEQAKQTIKLITSFYNFHLGK